MNEHSRGGIKPVRVAIGLIRRERSYLIRKRPPLPGSPMPGFWEFPGGKCELSETVEDAVRRECLEETGLAVRVLGLRRSLRHQYPHGFVELHYFNCITINPLGEPNLKSGFLWVDVADLHVLDFPEANEIILRELDYESLK